MTKKQTSFLGAVVGFAVLSIFSLETMAQEKSLSERLEELNLPQNQIPTSVAKETLYSVQSRHVPLTNRHEVGLLMGNNFNIDGHLSSQQYGMNYRYHINEKWAVGFNALSFDNSLSSAGERLMNQQFVVPERDYQKSQFDLMGEYNLFYGKFRLAMDTVLYFDTFVAAGVSNIELASGSTTGGVVDAGFSFWTGSNWNARLGLKNDFYNQQLDQGSDFTHNMTGYVAIGYLFGRNK